jgi:hypothetical protein
MAGDCVLAFVRQGTTLVCYWLRVHIAVPLRTSLWELLRIHGLSENKSEANIHEHAPVVRIGHDNVHAAEPTRL